MHQKTTYKNFKQALTKALCICIICAYALFPFGDFITTATHKASHIISSLSGDNHAHDRYTHQHTDIGNYSVPGFKNTNHDHFLVSFLSAAFSSDTDPVDVPSKITLSLDIHLISETLDFNPFREINSKSKMFSSFQKLIVRFSENTTPPPQNTGL